MKDDEKVHPLGDEQNLVKTLSKDFSLPTHLPHLLLSLPQIIKMEDPLIA